MSYEATIKISFSDLSLDIDAERQADRDRKQKAATKCYQKTALPSIRQDLPLRWG